jgi:hypothetical protein
LDEITLFAFSVTDLDMANYNVAWVEQVNATGSQPVLTLDELWQGCLLLARSPQTFTSVISKCELEADEGNTLTRTLFFSEGPQAKLKQTISLSPGTKVRLLYFPCCLIIV